MPHKMNNVLTEDIRYIPISKNDPVSHVLSTNRDYFRISNTGNRSHAELGRCAAESERPGINSDPLKSNEEQPQPSTSDSVLTFRVKCIISSSREQELLRKRDKRICCLLCRSDFTRRDDIKLPMCAVIDIVHFISPRVANYESLRPLRPNVNSSRIRKQTHGRCFNRSFSSSSELSASALCCATHEISNSQTVYRSKLYRRRLKQLTMAMSVAAVMPKIVFLFVRVQRPPMSLCISCKESTGLLLMRYSVHLSTAGKVSLYYPAMNICSQCGISLPLSL